MATRNGGNINFKINMEIDRSSLNQVLKPLQDIQKELNSMSASELTEGFEQAADSAKKLQSIINSSWNDKLKQLNLDKFNQGIKNSYGSISQLRKSLSGAGAAGEKAFNTLASQVLNTNLQLKESNKLLDDMATSMSNTVKWGITSSIFNNITGAIQKAYYYSKDLDSSLNDIRIVTGDSAEKMEQFAKAANETSKSLGRSTLDYTNAALSFYQQGLADEQVAARTQVTLKAQNITGAGKEMVDYLTSVWNGFKISAEDTEGIVDKLAKVADSSASDMSQLAVAMSKVASTANVMGVDVDQLTAQLATVIATTRQAPESVGTAFKSIYTRMNDIKTGAEDAEISLGKYSGIMAELGFNVLDANGRLRDTGQVMEEIGSNWDELTREQQIYLAQTMGGLRQVNQLMSLFENWSTYSDLLNDSLTAQGTLTQKNNVYLQSSVAHIKALRAQSERTYDILFNPEAINTVSDLFNTALKAFNDYIEGIGGGANVFLNLGATAANVFNKQIGSAINQQIKNIELLKNNIAQIKAQQGWSKDILDNVTANHATRGDSVSQKALQKQAAITQKTLQVRSALTQQQYNYLQGLQQEVGLAQTKIDYLNEHKVILKDMNLSENTSVQIIKDRLSVGQQELDLQKLIADYIELSTIPTRQLTQHQRQRVQLADDILLAEGEQAGILVGISQQQQNIIERLQTQNLSEEQLRALLHEQNNLILKQENYVNRVKQAAQGRQAVEDGTLRKLKEQENARERIISQQQKSASRQIQIQSAVRITSGLIQAASAAMGGISIAMDEASSSSEKLNGAWEAGFGTLSGIANMFAPGSGILIQGFASLVKSGLQFSGIWDKLEERFKSTSEKINDFNQKTVQVNSQLSANSKNIKLLKDIEQEWNSLSLKVGNYGENLKNLTEEEQSRYHQLVDIFTQYNESVIQGYDSQGEKIVKNNDALRETIDLLESQQSLQILNTYGSAEKAFSTADLSISQQQNTVDQLKKNSDAAHSLLQSAQQEQQKWLQQFDNQNDKLEELKTQILGKYYGSLDEFTIFQEANGFFASKDERDSRDKLIKSIQSELESRYGWTEDFQDWIDKVESETDPSKIQQYAEQFNQFNEVITYFLNSAWETKNKNKGYKEWSEDYNFGSTRLLENILNVQNGNLTKLKDKVDQADSKLKEGQAYLQKNLKFDANLIMTFIKYVNGYNKQWKALVTDENEGQITQLLFNYINSLVPDLGNEDIINDSNKTASSTMQALTFAQEFLDSLAGFYNTVESEILNVTKNNTNLEEFEGSSKEYEKELVGVIQTIIDNLEQDLLKDGKKRQDIIKIISQFFDLSDIKLKLEDNHLNVKSITTNLGDSVSRAEEQIETALKNFGYDKQFIGEALLKDIFNFNTEDVSNIIDNLDWGAFLKYKNAGLGGREALKRTVQDYKDLSSLSSTYEGIDPNLIFNTNEDFTNKLSKQQKLNDDQVAYLALLQSEDQQLAKLASIQGHSSQDYINRLKQILPLIQARYERELKISRLNVENQIANQQAILNSNAKEEQKLNAQTKLSILRQKDLSIGLELEKVEYALAAAAKARADSEQQATMASLKKQVSIPDNIKSALSNLKKGSSLSSDEISTLAQLEKTDNNLKNIAKDKGIYSKEYTNELEKHLKIQQDLSEQAKQQLLLSYQRRKAEIDSQIAILQAQNKNNEVSKQQYDRALEKIRSEEQLNDVQKEYYQEIIASYELMLSNQEKINELQQQSLEISSAEFSLRSNSLEEQSKSISQLAKSFDELKQSLQEGKELTQQQMSSLDDVFKLVLDKYPELEWCTSRLTKTWLAGTDEYKEALREVSEALNQIVYDDLLSFSNETLDQINELLSHNIAIEVDSDGFDAWLREVQDFLALDREISIQVKSNADEQFDRISEEIDNIYKAASKIGENFVVSADDLKALNDVFPGILDGIALLEDGTFQLNSQIAQQAIATAQGTIDADASAVKAQLDNQAVLFRTKASLYRKIGDTSAKLAQEEAENEQQVVNFRKDLSDNLSEVQRINSQLVKDQVKKDQVEKGNSSLISSGKHSESWLNAFEQENQAAYNSATNHVNYQNYKARASVNAAKGQITQAPQPPQSANISSSTVEPLTNDSSSSAIDNITGSALAGQVLTKEQYGILAQDAYDQAAFYDKLADDYQNASTLIDANLQRLDMGLANVSSGKDVKGTTKTKTQKADHIDYLTDVADIYHTIDQYIKKVGKDLSFVSSQQKKLYGKNLIDNLQAQYTLLEKQVKAYETKIQLAEQQRSVLQGSLAAQGVAFDAETGAISNYVAILNAKQAEVNQIIAYYNSLSKDQQEAYKQVVNDAKKDYEEFKKNLDNYDKIVNETLPELRNQIQDARDEQIELAIKNFKIKVDVTLDLSQATRNWNKFKKTVINQTRDDNIIGNIQSQIDDFFSYYDIEGISTIGTLTEQLNKTSDQIRQINATGTSSVYGDNQAQALQDLQSYLNSLMSGLEDVEKIVDNVKQSFFDMVDKAQEAFDEQKKELELIDKLIDHDKKLVQSVYGKDSYDKLDRFYQKQKENDVRSLQTAKAQKDFWWDQMQIQKARMDNLNRDSNAYKEAEDRLKQLEDHWMNALNNFNSSLQTALSNLTDQYKNKLKEIFKDLNNKVTGGKGLDSVGEEWEFIKKENDLYLDDADTLYQVNKFANSFNKIFNNNSKNLKVQRSLSKVYDDQLKYLASKERLTQYDVDRAAKILQIQEKRLALEQIRQNRTRLRLRRDSQGNYSYQYVADQDEILKAIQELDDAKHDLYTLDKEQYQKNLNDIYQLYVDFQQELQELYEQEPVNTQHRQQREKEIRERYGGLINKLTEDNTNIRKNLEQSTFNAIAAGIQRINEDSHTSAVYRTNLQDQTLKNLFTLYEQYYAQRKAALEELLRNGEISQQEYNARVAELENEALGHSQETYKLNENAFNQMSQNIKNQIMTSLVPEWDSGVQHMADVFVGQGGFQPVCSEAFAQLAEAASNYEQGIHQLAQAGGVDLQTLAAGFDENIARTETLLRNTQQLFNEYAQEMGTVQALIDQVNNLVNAFNNVRQAAINAAQQAQRLLNLNAQAAINAANNQGGVLTAGNVSVPSGIVSSSGSLLPTSSSTNTAPLPPLPSASEIVDESSPIIYYDTPSTNTTVAPASTPAPTTGNILTVYPTQTQKEGIAGAIWFFRGAAGWGNDPFRATRLSEKFSPEGAQEIQQYINAHGPNRDLTEKFYNNQDYLRNFFFDKFDTGGYTGVWSTNPNQGRLAILHQKELVLNKDDTENILEAVNVVRSISEYSQNQLFNLQEALLRSVDRIFEELVRYTEYSRYEALNNSTQNVYISADFPSVNTSREIEIAFANLTNRASQYIHSTTRTRRGVVK